MKPHIRKVRDSDYWACDGILGMSPVLAYWMWKRWGPQHDREADHQEVS